MPTETLSSQLKVKIGGAAAAEDVTADIVAIEVQLETRGASAARLLLSDSQRADPAAAAGASRMSTFAIGKEIEIAMSASEAEATAIFKGEITAVQMEYSASYGTTIEVTAHDKLHRLFLGTNTRSFKTMKYSEIASQLAGEAGLSGDVDPTTLVHPFLVQPNVSNGELLMNMAEEVGYELWSDNTKLYFKKPNTTAASVAELKAEENLTRFQITRAMVDVAPSVEVRGWDPKQKQTIVGTANRMAAPGMPGSEPQKAVSAFGHDFKRFVHDRAVLSSSHAQAMAKAFSEHVNSSIVIIEATTIGNEKLLAGKSVDIKNVGDEFSQKYRITRATHRWDAEAGYLTDIVCAGLPQPSVAAPARPARWADVGPVVAAAVIGIVTNIKDDEANQPRVKVKFPWLPTDGGTEFESDWARVALPGAGKDRGMFWMPEVNDEVLVVFEHGDMRRPIVVGGLYNSQDTPPAPVSEFEKGGEIVKRVFRTRAGHVIRLDDTSGSEKIEIIDKTGVNSIVFDSKENTITVKADKDVKVEAKGNIEMKATGDIKAEATGKVSIKGTGGVDIESSATAKLKAAGTMDVEGASTTVKGSAQATFDGGGMATVKGGMVKIN